MDSNAFKSKAWDEIWLSSICNFINFWSSLSCGSDKSIDLAFRLQEPLHPAEQLDQQRSRGFSLHRLTQKCRDILAYLTLTAPLGEGTYTNADPKDRGQIRWEGVVA